MKTWGLAGEFSEISGVLGEKWLKTWGLAGEFPTIYYTFMVGRILLSKAVFFTFHRVFFILHYVIFHFVCIHYFLQLLISIIIILSVFSPNTPDKKIYSPNTSAFFKIHQIPLTFKKIH